VRHPPLLDSLASGDFLPGSIEEVELGAPTVLPDGRGTQTIQAETIPQPYSDSGPFYGVAIYLNSDPGAMFGGGSLPSIFQPYGSDIALAATLIHELGHAVNFLYGDGSSAILQGDAANPALSKINIFITLNDCFGGPK